MKKIEAIIRTSQFYEVKDAIMEAGIEFFTFSDVKAVGAQKKEAVYRGHVYDMGAIARTKLEIVLSENLETVVQKIIETAKTGVIGDGRLYVYDVVEAHRIRTGETGKSALGN